MIITFIVEKNIMVVATIVMGWIVSFIAVVNGDIILTAIPYLLRGVFFYTYRLFFAELGGGFVHLYSDRIG